MESPAKKSKRVKLETTTVQQTIVKQYQCSLKTIKRRNRRKKSKGKYYKSLKKRRFQRKTEELCAGIGEFSVIDMEWAPSCELQKLPVEVTEWQKQEQIAYWKSRAISLEIENRMLHQHLRNVYAQQIEYYDKSKEWKEVNGKSNESNEDDKNDTPTDVQNNGKSNNIVPGSLKSTDISKTIKDIERVLPKTPEGKKRTEEMEKIYGDMAPKIMGMETAIQLNYERHVEQTGAPYWPNIPLKL